MATVVVIVGPSDDDSYSEQTALINIHPNLYFFSISSFVVSILLMASWFNENVQGLDEQSASTQWILLGAISFFVMVSGIAFRDDYVTIAANSTLMNGTYVNATQTVPICTTGVYDCRRVTFAILLGAVSAVVACLLVPWKQASRKCQSDISIMLFIGWLAGVALITFGTGPGQTWGNLYFSCYVCMYLSLHIVIVSTCGDEKTDRVPYGRARRGSGSLVDRNAVWDVAYERLERRVGRHVRHVRDRSDSYADMFAASYRWVSDSSSDHDDGNTETQQYIDGKYRKNQLYRLELWCILLIESIVNLIALKKELPVHGLRSPLEIWALVAPSLSIVVAFCGFSTCMRTTKCADRIQVLSVRFHK
jgi:hypothetical protein